MERREIVVVGGGLAGSASALALAGSGFDTILVAPELKTDGRSTALIGRSVAFLRRLGIMDMLADKAAPLAVMRIVDDTQRLFRAPTVSFSSDEIGLPAFGYNVLNADLNAALAEKMAMEPRLERRTETVSAFRVENDHGIVTLSSGEELAADLVVAADGRRSMLREIAGIRTSSWTYPQSAIVLNFAHRLPHQSVSTEFHTRSGPFTQVPLPGNRSSLVWVDRPGSTEHFAAMPSERLSELVEQKMHSILGSVTLEESIQRFPLGGTIVAEVTADRLALIGEAAHAFPPIGAQGLNLGLRDCETLTRIVSSSRDDPGRKSTLARFEAARNGDIRSRTTGVDLLNRSLLADFLPAQMARAVGLQALGAFGPLRRFAMREGIVPGAGLMGLPRELTGQVEERSGGVE